MTQKYEPVEWTDETPTQPGTLINKARLDQMQSAHHFADGFEEVDAIPTEDPGTDYHKVVYCTADSTFYRWDGNEWTADIDDDTKRLLEEHEADHNNPHQVTKAQVGLGNVDNTSDADKPISTATAAALAGKVDKLGSSPAGSYTKVTVNAQGQVTAGSNPATLAEAGITDAYTKSEINTKLADGSVTKLGTADVGSDTLPIKLVGGSPTPVADALAKDGTVVHLTGDEVLSNGVKANTTAGSSSASNTKDVPPRFVVQSTGFDRTALQGINRHYPVAGLNDKNGKPVAKLNISTTDTAIYAYLQAIGTDEGQATLEIGKFDRTTKTWSPTMANDALDAYLPMVRTTGAQTIAGIKTFNAQTLNLQDTGLTTGTVPTSETYRSLLYQSADAVNHGYLSFNTLAGGNGKATLAMRDYTGTNTNRCTLELNASSTPNVRIPNQRAYNASNTTDVATIGTLDAYTPMVRTSGNQVINGTKAFQSGLVGASVQLKTVDLDITAPGTSTRYSNSIMWTDENNVAICKLWIMQKVNGQIALGCDIKNSDGSWKFGQILAQGDVI